jgi:DNA-binding CsgD family transcriptional regulator
MENWLLDPAIPWPRIYDLLEGAGLADHSRDFLARVLVGVEEIIPFDVGCGVTEYTNAYRASIGLPRKTVNEYNEYYLDHLDFLPQSMSEAYSRGSDESLLPIIWNSYSGTEFVDDFCRSLNLGQTIVYFLPGKALSLTIHRARGSLAFTEGEKRSLRVLNSLINQRLRLYDRVERAEAESGTGLPSLSDILFRFPALSRREAEVARLSAQGKTARAIADDAKLSRRTIETQLQSAYAKLGVFGKRDLSERIRPLPGPIWVGEVLFPA